MTHDQEPRPNDQRETRLAGPKRLALVGHDGAGKTTLLAMFYREAASGRIPGIRLTAADDRAAAYLAEKIAAIEGAAASARSEAELKLRLHHGAARIELIVRELHGGQCAGCAPKSDQEFLDASDAVFFCLDAEGSASPSEQRRRQHEIESLLERCAGQSARPGLDRPVALLLTRFDRMLAGMPAGDAAPDIESGVPAEFGEKLLNERHDVTRHALAQYAPGGAIFAVSAFGLGAENRAAPFGLCPLGLDGPLVWLAEETEARDRADMKGVVQDPRTSLSRLKRILAAYERRYPRANGSFELRERVKALKRRQRRRWATGVALGVFVGLLGLAAFELKGQARHDTRWKRLESAAASVTALDDPAEPLAALDAFLREFPASPRRAEALHLTRSLQEELTARRCAAARRALAELSAVASNPKVTLRDQIGRARVLLAAYSEEPVHEEIQERLDDFLRQSDDLDIERARGFSRQFPTDFAARIEHYGDYLNAHQEGGFHISEALEAKDQILREWDLSDYKQAYDLAAEHPDDLAAIALRLREYLRQHPEGRHIAEAERYLQWWEKVSAPGQYRVMLRRGEVEPSVGKYLAGGGPDLGVVIEVAGTVYGPSSVTRNSRRPIWDFMFPQPITWKLNDPITIRIIDYDWSATEVFVFRSPPGDPLAIRLLSGMIKPANGGRTTLVFSSDFVMPALSTPE
jgi:Double-GTPase 2